MSINYGQQLRNKSAKYPFVSDEAIDLTIIVGQQILCRVTHVESFEKFYVQLDLDKATLVENALANFDAEKVSKHNIPFLRRSNISMLYSNSQLLDT